MMGEDPRQPSGSCFLLTSIVHIWGGALSMVRSCRVAQVGTGWGCICQAEYRWNLYQIRGLCGR